MSEAFGKISEAVIAGKIDEVKSLTQGAIDGGSAPGVIMDEGLLPGMDIVGQRMKTGEMFIPEVLLSARAMQSGLDLLLPLMGEGESRSPGTAVIGTVAGDLHDIGKNLVGMMLKGAGFNVIDLGTDVKPQEFADAVKENDANLVGLSALLTTTMPKMQETIETLVEAGLRDKVKVMAGGAPVTQEFVDKIGADAYGANAAAAVDRAKELMA